MEVTAMWARLSMCVVLLLCFWHGTHGARMLGAGGQSAAVHELPPCKDVPGGIQNWDCYDPPSTPLPPCDFKHQNPGIDCEPPAPSKASTAAVHELPPCKDVRGGIQNWDCYDPPSTPLPPCDFKHQNPGIDCEPPAPSKAFTAAVHELPPCKDVPGGIQNWDCYDPPSTPLPPCDFKHQNPGIDCEPPAPSKVSTAAVHELSPCKDVPGGIQNWDCYDPPSTPLPPCDFKHQNPGIDCEPPASSKASTAAVHELPPCKDVPGGIQNWDCYDPPSTPLPPCDFKHQNPGIDCEPPAPSKVSTAAVHELPPCKDVPGGIQNWDCYDPPSTPLPPCDFKHQNPGIDCEPPASKVTYDSARSGYFHHVQGVLPPCKDVPGGIQNWDCYDPPSTPLPPCDFKHQNPGIDCKPPASKVSELKDDSAQSGVHREQGMLPPCNFPGAIPGWDCFDPPQTPLPPCDFKHRRPGFDCWPSIPWSPPVGSP